MCELRNERNAEKPGRYAWPDSATFFQTRNGRRKRMCRADNHVVADIAVREGGAIWGGGDPDSEIRFITTDEKTQGYHFEPFGNTCQVVRGLVEHTPMNIDQIVAWARTDDGGRQYSLFEKPPRGGCMKWGLCDMPEDVNTALDAHEEGKAAVADQLLREAGWKTRG